MNKYIDVDLLKKSIAKMIPHDKCGENTLEELAAAEAFADTITTINEMPAADVEPVRHGEWVGEGDGYYDGEIVLDVWRCSLCGYCIDDGIDNPKLLPKYCQNCGGKMDEGKHSA